MEAKINFIKSKLLNRKCISHLVNTGDIYSFSTAATSRHWGFSAVYFAYFKLDCIDLNGSALLNPGISQARGAVLHSSPCLLLRPDHDVMRSAEWVFVVTTSQWFSKYGEGATVATHLTCLL